jgi:hypothetical protein
MYGLRPIGAIRFFGWEIQPASLQTTLPTPRPWDYVLSVSMPPAKNFAAGLTSRLDSQLSVTRSARALSENRTNARTGERIGTRRDRKSSSANQKSCVPRVFVPAL